VACALRHLQLYIKDNKMTEQEIIQKWKENTSAFGLMPEEMRVWLNKAKLPLQLYNHNGNWEDWEDTNFPVFEFDRTYRLRPDYQPPKPEPKIVRCEIVADSCVQNCLAVEHLPKKFGDYKVIDSLVRYKTFICFENANGKKIGIEDIATEIRNGGKVWACFEESE